MSEPWSIIALAAPGYLLGAVPGWWIGGGLAAFYRGGLLAPAALVSGQASGVVAVALTLSVVLLLRRVQGNLGSSSHPPSRLRRMVWDTDRVATEEQQVWGRALQ